MSSSATPRLARIHLLVSARAILGLTVTHTGRARSKDARGAGFFSLDGESGGHPGWLLGGRDVVDAEARTGFAASEVERGGDGRGAK
jgi:hypothetical protein